MNSAPQRTPRTGSDDFILVERLVVEDIEEFACSYVTEEGLTCGFPVYALATIRSMKCRVERQAFCDQHLALLFAQWSCGPDHIKPLNKETSAPSAVEGRVR